MTTAMSEATPWLLARQEAFVPDPPVCLDTDAHVYSSPQGNTLLRCRGCGMDLIVAEMTAIEGTKERVLEFAILIDVDRTASERSCLSLGTGPYQLGWDALLLTMRAHFGEPLNLSLVLALFAKLVPR